MAIAILGHLNTQPSQVFLGRVQTKALMSLGQVSAVLRWMPMLQTGSAACMLSRRRQ